MLDQNTDRMWFVIGAVIVGAAIIFIANGTLPDIFASISENFESSSEQALSVVDNINFNLLTADKLMTRNATLVSHNNGVWVLDVNPGAKDYSYGLQVKRNKIHIPYGKQFNVSYEVKSPVAIDASTDVNSRAIDEISSWRASDNDNLGTRRFNGEASIVGVDHEERLAPFKNVPIPANEWTTVTFSYVNSSEENENEISIYDYSVFGVRNVTEDTLRIEMRNIKGWISDPTE